MHQFKVVSEISHKSLYFSVGVRQEEEVRGEDGASGAPGRLGHAFLCL